MDDDVQMLLKSSEKDPFRKLLDGDFGLRTTYWSFGVGVGLIIGLTAGLIGVIKPFVVAHAIYSVPLTIGIWRAAGKYAGPKIWAVLAKVAAVVGVGFVLARLIAIFGSGA